MFLNTVSNPSKFGYNFKIIVLHYTKNKSTVTYLKNP